MSGGGADQCREGKQQQLCDQKERRVGAGSEEQSVDTVIFSEGIARKKCWFSLAGRNK